MHRITVVIPCRNEEHFIAGCLDSVLRNRRPELAIQIIVVDGESDDRTPEILRSYATMHSDLLVLPNPKRIGPAAQNIGLAAATGDFVLILDAHATIDDHYLETGVGYLLRHPDAYAVGGAMRTVPQTPSLYGTAIVAAITSRFGVGGSTFRVGVTSPTWTSTVFAALYRREILFRYAPYNEDLPRGYDWDFHKRMSGGKDRFLLIPDAFSTYYARSRPSQLIPYYLLEGFWAIYPFRIVGRTYLSLSHCIPALFVLSLVVLAALSAVMPLARIGLAFVLVSYAIAALVASVSTAIARKKGILSIILPILYPCIHVSYGIGSLRAFLTRPSRG